MDKVKDFFEEYGIYIAVIIFAILLKTFVAAPIRVNGESMMDTLHDKDIMILDKISYKTSDIKRFDVVVIKTDDHYLIKRVIGLPGENVEYKNNKLYINGKEIEEDFSHKKTSDFNIEQLDTKKVPDDMYFVLGDNRVNSLDSRIIGFIDKNQILRKTSFTIYPFNRFGDK